MNDATQPLRLVLGPDPYDGWPVLLSEDGALQYLEINDRIGAATTMREFCESLAPHLIDDLEEHELDAPFDPELVPGWGESELRPDARTWMLDTISEVLDDVLEGRVTILDSMGSNPVAVIEPDDLDELRDRLTAAGFDVVGWDALGRASDLSFDWCLASRKYAVGRASCVACDEVR